MSTRTIKLDDALYEYILKNSVRESALLRKLRAETSDLAESNMQISPEQGQLMHLLVKLIGGHRCLEIGVFTGYSSLSIATALPEDGQLIACDTSKEWTAIARRFWHEAGVQSKIDLRLAPAVKTLDQLLDDGEQARYDFAFIDADKVNYQAYYDKTFKLMRPGGLIAIDNTLWGGRVIDSQDDSEGTQAIRAFNATLYSDSRVDLSLVPISDGLTLARKRG